MFEKILVNSHCVSFDTVTFANCFSLGLFVLPEKSWINFSDFLERVGIKTID